jgi:anaerobic selenocysteine-containing dehydrogenase
MAEVASDVPGYAGAVYAKLESGRTRVLPAAPSKAESRPIALPEIPGGSGRLLLTTSRGLYTSLEGATIRSDEADKLHREEFLEINPADAAERGIGQNRPVVVSNGTQEIVASAALTDAVAAGSVYLPSYFEAGAVNRLLAADGSPAAVTVRLA